MNHIIDNGVWVENERTGKKCKTIINYDLEYDFCPLVTTRQSYYRSAVAEMIGYLRGYTNAADFRALGTKTWDANSNENEAWLNNPHRKGEDDMGRVYGAQGRAWRTPEYYKLKSITVEPDSFNYVKREFCIDQLKNIYNDLKNGVDNRGEIMSFYNVGEFHMGCLRPCIYDHQFSLLDGTLYLHSKQRSCDVPLGLNFNMVQLWFLLKLMAQITGHKTGKVYHKIVNAHIYEDQYELAKEEASRTVFPAPVMAISDEIKTLEDVETIFDPRKHVKVENYMYHPAIQYPFSV